MSALDLYGVGYVCAFFFSLGWAVFDERLYVIDAGDWAGFVIVSALVCMGSWAILLPVVFVLICQKIKAAMDRRHDR